MFPDWVFADILRERTATLHAQAEGTAFVRDMVAGRVVPASYALFARSLLEVYEALERGLTESAPELAPPELRRAPFLAGDVAELASTPVPLLPSGERYAARITELAARAPELLIAHAYTRYLGDLAGGTLLARALSRTLAPEQLSFYRFPAIADVRAYARSYRHALNEAARPLAHEQREAVAGEAEEAFRLNIALLEAVSAST